MFKLKYRKVFFLIAIACLAGGSMAVYSESETAFWLKTLQLICFQQVATIALYLICFAWDWPRSPRSLPFDASDFW